MNDLASLLLSIVGRDTPEARKALEPWTLVDCSGAVVMVCGPEVHVAAPAGVRGRWLSRRHVRDVLGSRIRTFGKATTTVMNENERGHAFVARLGFEEVSRDYWMRHYELKELRHA